MIGTIVGMFVDVADAVLDIAIDIAGRIDKYAEDHRDKV